MTHVTNEDTNESFSLKRGSSNDLQQMNEAIQAALADIRRRQDSVERNLRAEIGELKKQLERQNRLLSDLLMGRRPNNVAVNISTHTAKQVMTAAVQNMFTNQFSPPTQAPATRSTGTESTEVPVANIPLVCPSQPPTRVVRRVVRPKKGQEMPDGLELRHKTMQNIYDEHHGKGLEAMKSYDKSKWPNPLQCAYSRRLYLFGLVKKKAESLGREWETDEARELEAAKILDRERGKRTLTAYLRKRKAEEKSEGRNKKGKDGEGIETGRLAKKAAYEQFLHV
eukprot:CAMPEP_0185731186 /NCGR_PEP_ID=MMETSP1171-20130828/12138_1 /TAXON_ID=374046 /ORGANISM="Helicotheca tamensis, Strain CCMP826" /LENGTH=281 /DNA_ID=CAMNT_0028400395 /DNA_START=106 /DNA_END=951 /DNA_ORIENTATION=-